MKTLTYRFYNPNTAERTADFVLNLFIEANSSKVEQGIQCVLAKEMSDTEATREAYHAVGGTLLSPF